MIIKLLENEENMDDEDVVFGKLTSSNIQKPC